jgi:hypothetical protein
MAAVVPLWQLEAWQQRRQQFFGTIKELWEKNAGVKPEVIEQEVADAVQAVRAKPARRKK